MEVMIGNLSHRGEPERPRSSAKLVMLPPPGKTEAQWIPILRAGVPELRIVVAADSGDAKRELQDADAAYGFLPPDLLQHAPKLRWLQAPMAAPPAGYFHSDLIHHAVVVTNMRDTYSDHVAAQVLAYILYFARGLHVYAAHQRHRRWAPMPADSGIVFLPNARVLLLGAGGIGTEVARLLTPFGCTVVGVDATRRSAKGVSQLFSVDQLDAQLGLADFVVSSIPHTPETEGLMDHHRFMAMKSGSFYINVGRGMTTRLADLMAALQSGHLGGAALDVFELEPLPADHLLWSRDNVLVTPHVAAYGPQKADRRLQVFLENCRAFMRGDPLRNVVDKVRWF